MLLPGGTDSLLWDALNEIAILQGNAEIVSRNDTHLTADHIQLQIGKAFYSAEGHVKVRFIGEKDGSSEMPLPSFLMGGFTSNGSEKAEETVLNADPNSMSMNA